MRDLDWSDVEADARHQQDVAEYAERVAASRVVNGVRLAPGWSHTVGPDGDVLCDEAEPSPEYVPGDTWQTVVNVTAEGDGFRVLTVMLADGDPMDWPEVVWVRTLAEVAAEVDLAMFGWDPAAEDRAGYYPYDVA